MNWRGVASYIGLTVEGDLMHAFDYLEAHGQRFCVHFGVDNAMEKALDHWCGRKRRKRAK